MEDPIFSKYINTNKYRVQGYVKLNRWRSVDRLSREEQEINLPVWCRLHISHFLETLEEAKTYTRQLTSFDGECNNEVISRHTLAYCYKILNEPKNDWCPVPLKIWEWELHLNLLTEQRRKILSHMLNCEKSLRLQELSYRIARRWYRILVDLQRMKLVAGTNCWRGKHERGILLHML